RCGAQRGAERTIWMASRSPRSDGETRPRLTVAAVARTPLACLGRGPFLHALFTPKSRALRAPCRVLGQRRGTSSVTDRRDRDGDERAARQLRVRGSARLWTGRIVRRGQRAASAAAHADVRPDLGHCRGGRRIRQGAGTGGAGPQAGPVVLPLSLQG